MISLKTRDEMNKCQWHYSGIPDKDCKVIIKLYGGKYEIAKFENGVFKVNENIVNFKSDFKKWSY